MKTLHLPTGNPPERHAALVRVLSQLPPPFRRTLTCDPGTEMARQLDITAATGARVYFCDAAGPWQRGSNENAKGLLRQYPAVVAGLFLGGCKSFKELVGSAVAEHDAGPGSCAPTQLEQCNRGVNGKISRLREMFDFRGAPVWRAELMSSVRGELVQPSAMSPSGVWSDWS